MRTVILVTGPPCAGKSTYVAARAKPGDLVLDQDVIGPKAMRTGLAQVAAMTAGTAWVIRCCPGAQRRRALATQIRATDVVHLQPGETDLITRASRRPNPRRHIQAVRDWFQREAHPRPTTPAKRSTKAQEPRSRHRAGRPYRRAVAQMFALYGDRCHLCGHGGARQADHLTPISVDPGQPIDPHAMRPAHGGGDHKRGLDNPCLTCGRRCNQERGAKRSTTLFRPALRW